MKTKIKKVGFEIEGEFTATLIGDLRKYGEVYSDGTVKDCESGSVFHSKNGWNYITKEFGSFPLLPNQLRTAHKIFKLLEKDNRYHWNHSAGFHIHLSFFPKHPPEILSSQFCEYFLAEMEKRFPGALRQRKNNNFCEVQFDDKYIALERIKYRFINFQSSLSEHGTIEFRIFPSAAPKTLYQFLVFTLTTVKKFLNKGLEVKFENEFETEIPAQSKEIVEELNYHENKINL